jgi:hypothetical protein
MNGYPIMWMNSTLVSDSNATTAYALSQLPDDVCSQIIRLDPCGCEADVRAAYTTPTSDGAAWIDADDVRAPEFLGLLLTQVTNLDQSTVQTTSIELIGDGAVAGRSRRSGRSVAFRGLLFASSERGMEYGAAWLRATLLSVCEVCAPCPTSYIQLRRRCDDPFSMSITTTSASASVTTASTASLSAGMRVAASGVPDNATILSITNGTTFVLSANATASATVSASIYDVDAGLVTLVDVQLAETPRLSNMFEDGWASEHVQVVDFVLSSGSPWLFGPETVAIDDAMIALSPEVCRVSELLECVPSTPPTPVELTFTTECLTGLPDRPLTLALPNTDCICEAWLTKNIYESYVTPSTIDASVLSVEFYSGATAAISLTIKVFSNILSNPLPDASPAWYNYWLTQTPLTELFVPEIPADSTFKLDGMRQLILFEKDGVIFPGDSFAFSRDGSLWDWATIEDDEVMLYVSVSSGVAADATVRASFRPRMGG